MEKKLCRFCGEEKTILEFIQNKSYKNGHSNICKSCYAKKYDQTNITTIEKSGLQPVEIEMAIHVIQSLGYEYPSEIPVYIQFHERHNLPL